ncbi:hypothetical protein Fcan01_23185 [Folsomia candida]|uniref:Uncharacterized protein n=1 Tax=Folsomia candida TaxID=158441 RepID=A0A226DB55_FOLCA|nr:hypothetical protein Fcan01_23185 [Folsomia candida]
MEAFCKRLTTMVCVSSVVINGWILGIVLKTKKPRCINILIANWSLLTILASLLSMFDIGEGSRLITNCTSFMCPLLSFLRTWFTNMYPLEVLSLVAEACRQLGPRFDADGSHLTVRRILTCWLLAGLGAVQAGLGTEYAMGKCVKVGLVGSEVLGGVVELWRGVVFHVGVGGWMILLMYKNRGKFTFLLKFTGNWKLSSRLKRIRFLFIYTIIFVIFWIPFGIALCWYQINEVGPVVLEMKENAPLANLAKTGFTLYMAYTPMVIYWAGDIRLEEKFWAKFSMQKASLGKEADDDGEEMSGISMVTIRKSSTSEGESEEEEEDEIGVDYGKMPEPKIDVWRPLTMEEKWPCPHCRHLAQLSGTEFLV